MALWIEFETPIATESGPKGAACVHLQWQDEKSVEQVREEAVHYAGIFGVVKAVYSLPYGTSPSLDGADWGDFCHSPVKCKGHSACPRPYSCSE